MTAIALAGLVASVGCGGGSSGAGAGAPSSNAAPGVLTPSSTSVSFGNVAVGTRTSQPVMLTDTGNSNVTISSVSVTGNGLSVSGGSNVTLTPNQSVTIYVDFDPPGTGTVQGDLSVSSNASNPDLQIGVTGTGFVQHSVSLMWQPSTSVVVGYYVYRGPAPGNLSKLTGTIDMVTNYTDGTVSDGQSYTYAVTAVDSENVESTQSTPVTVTIPAN